MCFAGVFENMASGIYIYIYISFRPVQAWTGLVQSLRLSTGRTGHKGSRNIALLFLDHGTRRGSGVSVALRPVFTPGKDPVPIVQEAGWAWTGAVNLASIGIRSPDRLALSQSLYQLRYPAHICAARLLISGTAGRHWRGNIEIRTPNETREVFWHREAVASSL